MMALGGPAGRQESLGVTQKLLRMNWLLIALLILVAGVFAGSGLWWLMLSGGVSLFRTKFTPHRLRWVNRLSGIIIIGFGLLILLSLIW